MESKSIWFEKSCIGQQHPLLVFFLTYLNVKNNWTFQRLKLRSSKWRESSSYVDHYPHD